MTPSPLKRAVGIFSAAASILPVTGMFAAEVSWDNPTSGPFTTATNWSTDTVPTNIDDAIIANGGTAEIETGNIIDVSRLLIQDGTVNQTGGTISTVPFGDYQSPGAYEVGGVGGLTGHYNVSGESTLTGGRVRVGYAGGTGHMTMSGTSFYQGSGGQDTWLGNGSGSVGTLTMTDDAQWAIQADWLVVGRSGGTGTLTMSGNTQMTVNGGGNIVFGDGAGSTGNLNMSGSSKLSNPNGVHFVFGNEGTAVGTLSGNAIIEIQNQVQIGNGGGANATLTINGAGAVLRSADDWLVIGRNGGTANVTLENGLIERTGPSGGRQMIIADGGGANGTLTVNGGEVKSNSELWIGQNGTGKLVVNDGSVTTESWIAVGRDGAGSSGTLEIHGGSVNKNGSGQLVLNGATSILTQTGGALNVNSGETWLAEFGDKTATWTASGGTANLGTITRIGVDGIATMTISGTADYTNQTIYIASNASSTGTLNLNGGTFTANFIEEGAGNGFINFNGGVLRAGAASANFLPDFEVEDINVQAGGLKFDTNSHAVTITNHLAGVGGLTKQGAGVLTMTGVNTFAGASAVDAGTLVIASTGALDDVVFLAVASGAALELENAVSLNDEIVLTLASGSSFVLDFEGTETIGAISLGDEGFLAVDTYTVAELVALGSGVDFTGSNPNAVLNVTSAIPEPTTVALLAGGMAMVCWRLRRRS